MRTKSALEYLENTVSKNPYKVAVIEENASYTYKKLQDEAKIIGSAFHDILNGKIQQPIMLFMEKSFRCMAAMFGTMYSGNIYVPMDIKTPIDRLNSILSTLESDIILTTRDEKNILEKIGYEGSVYIYEEIIEEYQTKVQDKKLEDIQNRLVDADLMYILFTSGSTGVPKGVAVAYRSIVDYIEAFMEEVSIMEDDVLGNQTPFYADMSLKDIYMSVYAGATICIIPQKYFMSPKKLLQFLSENGVTSLSWVPTAYRIIAQFDGLSKIRPSMLKRFLFSGEAMPIAIFKYWKQFYSDGIYIQQYGPTEITGACTSFLVERDYTDDETIPIGKPFRNTGIMLLDENDNEIKSNVQDTVGEICVFGTCLAAGYYNNPQKTQEVFVQNPLVKGYESKIYRTGDLAKWDEEGNLVFISRKDYQIKHGGKRIELGEIEAAVQAIENIKACCCVHNREKDALVLYYIGDISSKEILQQLQEKIPKYMIPTVYHARNELPILLNGKLNRKLMDEWANDKK